MCEAFSSSISTTSSILRGKYINKRRRSGSSSKLRAARGAPGAGLRGRLALRLAARSDLTVSVYPWELAVLQSHSIHIRTDTRAHSTATHPPQCIGACGLQLYVRIRVSCWACGRSRRCVLSRSQHLSSVFERASQVACSAARLLGRVPSTPCEPRVHAGSALACTCAGMRASHTTTSQVPQRGLVLLPHQRPASRPRTLP